MIAVTYSLFGESKTRQQIENEIEFGVYENEEIETQIIDKSNPHWSTEICRTYEDSIDFISSIKKLKSFSCIVAIRNLNDL
jgi:hypothetical protein